MSAFRYEAARADGHQIRGTVDATTRQAAAATLSARGLFPLAVEPASEASAMPSWRRSGARAQATVIQSLATLVDAGVPLERALAATEPIAAGVLRPAVARIGANVREGASLGTALAAEAPLFSGVTVGLARAGERGVGLGPALAQAAAQLEREAETAAHIRAALAYPVLLACVGSISVGVIVLFVVPRFAAILGDLGQALPPATRALIAISETVRRDGWWLAGVAAVTGTFALQELRRRRAAWHAFLLRLPVLGPLRHALATARVSRTLGALLGTGTPALVALAIARDAAGDAAVAARLDAARERVAEGRALTTALGETAALTPAALQLAGIGESAGRLPVLLARAADLEEQGAERRLRTLVGLLEPALIVAFAGVVAFVAAALLQAVYSVRPG